MVDLHPTVAALLLVASVIVGVAPTPDAGDETVVAVYHGPDPPRNASTLRAAISDGRLSADGRVVEGETLIVAIRSERLAADLAAERGSPTARFFALVDGNLTARLEQTDTPVEFDPIVVPLGPANTTVLPDGDWTYLLVNTSALDYRRDSGPAPSLETDNEFAVVVGYGAGGETAPKIQLAPRSARFAPTRPYDVLSPRNVDLLVDVFTERGAFTRVRLRLDDGRTISSLARRIEDARVAELDLSAVEPGTNYTLTLVHDDRIVQRVNGTVRSPRLAVSNVRFDETPGGLFLRATVGLSHGGTVSFVTGDGRQLREVSVPPLSRENATRRVTVEVPDDAREVLVSGIGPSDRTKLSYTNTTVLTVPDRFRTPTASPTPRNTPTPSVPSSSTSDTAVSPTTGDGRPPDGSSPGTPNGSTTAGTDGEPTGVTTPGFTALGGVVALAVLVVLRVRQ